jgi:hypothetical protein
MNPQCPIRVEGLRFGLAPRQQQPTRDEGPQAEYDDVQAAIPLHQPLEEEADDLRRASRRFLLHLTVEFDEPAPPSGLEASLLSLRLGGVRRPQRDFDLALADLRAEPLRHHHAEPQVL